MTAEDARHVVRLVDGGRLDAVLATALDISRSRLQALIEGGHVTVDGQVLTRTRHKVVGGEKVVVVVPAPPSCDLVAQDLGVPVLHMDDAVVVVDKPADMVVHPAKGHLDGTLVNALLHLIHTARVEEGAFPTPPTRPGVVHRLDRGTSGLLVVARTPDALTHLSRQFAARTVERRYAALVWGRPKTPTGSVDAPIGRHDTDRQRQAVQEDGKPAVTHWEVLGEVPYVGASEARSGVLSLVQCRLETGRMHQIRVHMHHIGLPLVGDPLYGRKRPLPASLRDILGSVDHQLLHAGRLGFDHPSGERLRFQRPPPADFQAVLAALGLPIPFEGPLPDASAPLLRKSKRPLRKA